MSGHSKWSKVKYQKAVKDPIRGKAFSKMSNLITIAARDGGDPNSNPKLRVAIEKAKTLAMPKANIERAIKRGSGESEEGKKLEEMFIEAYGPEGVAVLIQVISDNKNRVLAELRHLLPKYQAKMAKSGSVRYLFKEMSLLIIPKEKWNDDLYLRVAEKGAEDVQEDENQIIIIVPPKQFSVVKEILLQTIPDEEIKSDINWISDQEIPVTDESTKKQLESLFAALKERDDVENVYSNASY